MVKFRRVLVTYVKNLLTLATIQIILALYILHSVSALARKPYNRSRSRNLMNHYLSLSSIVIMMFITRSQGKERSATVKVPLIMLFVGNCCLEARCYMHFLYRDVSSVALTQVFDGTVPSKISFSLKALPQNRWYKFPYSLFKKKN